MNSKLTLSKSMGGASCFQVRSLVLAALLGLVLTGIWLTSLGIPFTDTQRPLYFAEAPYWHIGLYVSICVTMGYAIIGAVGLWFIRRDKVNLSK